MKNSWLDPMNWVRSAGIYISALLAISCDSSRLATFEVATPSDAGIVGVELHLCGQMVAMQSNRDKFVASVPVICEGKSAIVLLIQDGSQLQCDGTYVTPGMGRLDPTSLNVIVKDGSCSIESMRGVGK